MTIYKFSIIALVACTALIPLSSCQKGQDDDGHEPGSESDEHGGHEHAEENEGETVHLSEAQLKEMNIELGNFEQIKVRDFVNATGILGLPPNSFASVSAIAEGFVKKSKKLVNGDRVYKGEKLAEVENPDFIERQREYLETVAELTYLQKELERQQKLVEANAGVEKNLQKLQSEVGMKTARMKGIAKQLAYWGIDVQNLTPENIVDHINIIAPMTGYITAVNMHDGMYVSPEEELVEIVNDEHLHLELDIFEKDISKIKEGQRISYTVPALGDKVYDGEVHIIGKQFNTENKTVRIHGHLIGERPPFIKDLYIEAKIWLNDQTVEAVPEDALIKDGNDSFVFITDGKVENGEINFRKLMVIPGVNDNGYTAVKPLQPLPENARVVIKGAYFVYAQSKVGELEHEH